MNSLSWLIYGAEVIPSIGNLAGVVGAISGLGWIALNGITAIARGHHNDMSRYYKGDPIKGVRREHGFVMPRLWILPVVVLAVATVIPSKQTIYMIAASEMGQKVYETPATQGLLGDLHAIVKKELAKMKEAK